MTARRRFALLVLLLAAALALCVWMTVQGIEQDLMTRAQIALAEANVPFFGVEVNGRDVYLTGFVVSEAQGARILALVSGVEGIRRVEDRMVVERVPDPAEWPTEPAGALPQIRLQRLGSDVFVSGSLGDDGEAPALRSALEERFGTERVVWSVRERSTTASPSWVSGAARLAEILTLGAGDLRIVIAGRTATLSGQVPDAETATRLRDAAARVPELSWRVDLFTPSGPASGGDGP